MKTKLKKFGRNYATSRNIQKRFETHYDMSSNIRVQRVCRHCNTEFTAKTTVTKYCTDICAKRDYKKRKRDGKIVGSNIESVKIISIPLLEIQSKEFLSINETCLLLGISRQTVWRAIKNNRLEAGQVGGRVVIRRLDIDRLFSQPKDD